MTTILRRLAVRLRAVLRRRATDTEIDDELRYHLERDADRFIAGGMSSSDARFAARRALGNTTVHAERARDEIRLVWLEQLRQDIRYAVRALRAAPVFTATAALSLALGVGANVLMFSAASALLLRELPVRAPEQLAGTHGGSYSMYQAFRAVPAFSDVAAVAIVDRSNLIVAGHANAGLARVELATGNYFTLLGVGAAAGRTLAADDDGDLDAHPLAVISHRYWQRQLDGAHDVVGKTLMLNKTTYTILGVAQRGFDGESVGRPVDVWIPMSMQSEVMPEWPGMIQRGTGFLRMLMRLRPGVSVTQAQAAMQPAYRAHEIWRAGANASPEFRRNLESDPLLLVSIAHGYASNRDDAARSLGILLGVVGLVLLIACTNVATLFLVRGAARAREMAVRAAIGAGRARLIRQVLTEAVVLSLLGGAIGLLLALWGSSALSTTHSLGPVQLDTRAPSSFQSFDFIPGFAVYALAVAASVTAGILVGIVPALRAARVSSAGAMLSRRNGIGSTGRGRVGSGLVVAQIALSLMLLVGTGLFVRSLRNLRTRDLGIDRSHLLLAWTVPAQTGRGAAEYPAYLDRIIEKLMTIPGIVSVSATNHGLLEGSDTGGESSLLTIDGQPAPSGLGVLRDAVGPQFFSTAGMTLIAGRDLRPSDDTSQAKVAVMSESMARYFFGSASAIGKRLGTPRDPMEIVGVVRDTKHGSPRDKRGVWYVSYRQYPGLFRSMCLVVRTRDDPATVRPIVQKALRAFDSTLPVLRIDTVSEQLDDVLFQERLIANVSAVFAGLAALLASIGLYGVVSYGIARRTNEIGVRVALGATSTAILQLVLRESVLLSALGVSLGIPGALILARLVSSKLFGIGATDPVVIGSGATLMLLVALLASFLPAQRAVAIDPATTLRAD